jgi:exonuclease III
MDHRNKTNRSWKVLCWNIRGINSVQKWNALKSKINEASCDIICLQETKRAIFHISYIKKFCPAMFDSFEFVPLEGASDGTLLFGKVADSWAMYHSKTLMQ